MKELPDAGTYDTVDEHKLNSGEDSVKLVISFDEAGLTSDFNIHYDHDR